MPDQFQRTRLLFGEEAMKKIFASRVAVFGIGGVGGYVVEALARSGVGALDLIDNDEVCLSNLNRQIIATRQTLGQYKAEVARERVAQINPECQVRTYRTFYLPDTQDRFDFTQYDYVVDAIDTVTGKLTIIQNAKKAGTPVISCMGTGNKMNPAALEVADIYETSICPLAKVMRRECRKRGIESLKVVYSREEPLRPKREYNGKATVAGDTQDMIAGKTADASVTDPDAAAAGKEDAGAVVIRRRDIPGSTAFVPGTAGLIIAAEVIKDLITRII